MLTLLSKSQAKEKLTQMGLTTATNANTTANTANAASANTLKGTLAGLTTSIKATWAAMSMLQKASIVFAAASTIWSIGSSIFSSYKQHQEEIRQATEEAAQAYKESASSIDDYVSRYQELRKALIAAKGDEEETLAVKRQLLDLQTEINDKFGATCGTIDLVTDSYRDMTQAIKDYNKELANNYLNENEKGIHDAEKQMTKKRHYNLSYSGMVATTDKGKALKEIAEKYKDKGIDLLNEGDGGVTFSVYLDTDAGSAYDVINDFETDLRNKAVELGDEHLFDDVLEMSSNSLNNAKSVVDEYGDIFKRSLIAKIASDDNKATVYNDALKAVEEYNNAVLESEDPYSDKKVASARQNLEEIKQSIQSNTEEWGQYSSVMDDVFNQADTRLIDFNDKLQNDDSLKKYAGELKGLDTLDLQSFDQNAGKNNAFDKLKESAGSCGVSVDELIDRLVKMGIVQDEIAEEAQNIPKPFSQRFQDLWDSESFKDAREELQKLSKEAGITEDDLYSLARENEELSLLLDESGISAQFAATCFNQVCNGADGFSAITEDALALDQVLHGMDESLQSAAASKSAYDKAMEQDDYDSEFKNYQDAYKSAMEMFENGDYGKHFRSAMEYLLGDKSYTMSIEEMKNAMDGLKNVFGEDATNGLEFLDKLYEKKDVLDGLDSSLEKLSDGSYKFDLKPDEFEAIGEAIGMTTDEVAACTNALGMFGDFRSYDMEELEETLNGISIAAKDGEKSILSLQGVESILPDRGYNGYEIYHILEDIKGMGSLELLDFNASDSEGLQTVIDKLSELDMLKINGDSIDVSGLADKLKNTFGMTFEDIQTFLASLGEGFDFTDSMGTDVVDAYSSIQEKKKSIQAEIASGSYSTDEIVQMQTQLEELKRRADALREPVDIKLTSNIEQTKAKLEEVTRKYNELKTSIASKQEQGITVTYGDTNALNELANQKAALEEQLNHYNELKVTVEMEREQADADIKDLTSDKETKLTVNIANKGEVDAQFNQWTQPKSTTLKVNVTANDPNGLLKGGTPTSGQAGNSGNSSSSSPASGTVKALGNAQIGHSFADGTIGAPKTETALINELGNETIIDPESGTYEIVKGGAQFRKIKKGQIILNHLQTQALQKYGKISSFGKMLFGGNAKLKGSSYASGEAGATNPGTKKPYNNNGSSRKPSSSNNSSDSASRAVQKAADTAKEATEEIFDWIERRIKKFQAAFDKWVRQAETAVTSGFINKYYKKATSAIKNELSTYGKAYKRYMKQADSVGLSKKYRDKVKNGTIDIETIKDEKLAEQIKKYQEYYDKAQESTASFVETAEKLYNLPLDKAATKIEKFSDAIDLLDKKLDNAVGAKSKNKLIDKQTKEEKKTLDAYKEANKATKKDLKSAKKELSKSKNLNSDDGITKKEKKKIKDAIKAGKEVDLSYFKVGSAGYNAAVKYNEALKANTQSTYDLKSAQEDYKSWLSESSTQKFENIQTDYEHKLHEFEQRAQEIDNKISLNEEKGYLASSVYYDKLLANERQNNAKLMEERDKLVKSLNDSVSSGNLKEYSDDWYDLKEKIDSVTNSVDESTVSIQNFINTMREIKWDRFDKIQSNVSGLLEDVKFAINELSRTELVSDKLGGFTDNGKSAATLHISGYETNRVLAADYAREIRSINEEISKNPYDTKLVERKRELVKAYQDCISGAQEEKYAVIDLYKQAYDSLLNKIRELINEYEELLDAEKNAYDYQQSIAEKTKDIADIRKQLTAYSGDMSEETRAKVQKLEVDLKEAEKSLQEAQYEKYISDTKDMFDDLEDALSDEINDIILALADNFDRLIENINAYSNDAMANVNDYLSKIGFDTSSSISNVGLLITNALKSGTDVSNATYTTVDEIRNILEKMQQYVDSIANGGNASSGADSTATSQPIASAEEQKRQALAGDMAALQSQLESLYRQKTDTEDQYNKDIEKAKASSSKYKDKAKEEKNSKKKKEYEAKKKEYDAQAKSLEKEKKNEIGSISKDIAKLEQELKLLDALLNSKINPATPKYAKGSKNIPFEQWAVTQEKGRELICTADGQMLTPLGKGDKVFTKEMSDNLWGLSQTSLEELENIWNKKLTYGGLNKTLTHEEITKTWGDVEPIVNPTQITRNLENHVNVQVGDINMHGVNDPEAFGQQMRDEFCRDGKTTRCMVEVVGSKFTGKGIGSARLYR